MTVLGTTPDSAVWREGPVVLRPRTPGPALFGAPRTRGPDSPGRGRGAASLLPCDGGGCLRCCTSCQGTVTCRGSVGRCGENAHSSAVDLMLGISCILPTFYLVRKYLPASKNYCAASDPSRCHSPNLRASWRCQQRESTWRGRSSVIAFNMLRKKRGLTSVPLFWVIIQS